MAIGLSVLFYTVGMALFFVLQIDRQHVTYDLLYEQAAINADLAQAKALAQLRPLLSGNAQVMESSECSDEEKLHWYGLWTQDDSPLWLVSHKGEFAANRAAIFWEDEVEIRVPVQPLNSEGRFQNSCAWWTHPSAVTGKNPFVGCYDWENRTIIGDSGFELTAEMLDTFRNLSWSLNTTLDGKQWKLPLEMLTQSEATHTRPAPIITECALMGGFAADENSLGVDGQVDVYWNYYVLLEVWNPSTQAIEVPEDGTRIWLKIKNLPKFTPPECSLPETIIVALDLSQNLGAGSVQILSSPRSDEGAWSNGTHHLFLGRMNYSEWMQVNGTLFVESATLNVELFASEANLADDDPISQITTGTYSAFSLSYGLENPFLRRLSSDGLKGMGRRSLSDSGYGFTWHFKLKDAWSAQGQSMNSWLTYTDVRAVHHLADIDKTSDPSQIYWIPYVQPHPFKRAALFQVSDFFCHYPYDGKGSRVARLWPLGASNPVTWETLRFMYWEGLAPSCFGSKDYPHNEWLDQYVELPENFASHDSTDLLKDRGQPVLLPSQVCINSLNEAEWSAVLLRKQPVEWAWEDASGNQQGWVNPGSVVWTLDTTSGYDWPVRADLPVPVSDQNAFYPVDETLYANRYHLSFLQPYRPLSEIDAQRIAHRMTAFLHNRGQPFRSLQDWVESGVLSAAIEGFNRAEINGQIYEIPLNAPAYLGVDDLAAHLLPVVSSRQDSFQIEIMGRASVGRIHREVRRSIQVRRLPSAVSEASVFTVVQILEN
jgi:hypothetical protein